MYLFIRKSKSGQKIIFLLYVAITLFYLELPLTHSLPNGEQWVSTHQLAIS